MKIFTPLRSKNDADILVETGSDEFFAGVMYEPWDKRFGREIELNRRSFCGEQANFRCLEDLDEAIKIVHNKEKKLFLTLNHHQFTNVQLPYLKDLIRDFKGINGDGIIVADPNALEMGKELGLKTAISTDWNVYNSETVKFFKKMGADRVILSRDMSFDDIKAIREDVPDIEIEVFMINGPCKFSDSMCFTTHSTEWGAFCRFLDGCNYDFRCHSGEQIEFKEQHNLQLNNFYYHKFFLQRACGICAIWRLLQINIDACKVVGRVLPIERIKSEVGLVKRNIEIAKTCNSEHDYLERMDNPFKSIDKDSCKWGFQCYFPDVINY